MKCPLCKNREHVEIGLHADGYSQDIRECGDCGGIWTFSGDKLKIIKSSTPLHQATDANFKCPTCRCTLSHETDLNAFQFHEEIYECLLCGTVCSASHNLVEVVNDSQGGSFLDSTGELVEADDYNFM